MRRNDEGGKILTNSERRALALVLVADMADDFEWEDVPELAEMQFSDLEEEDVREHLWKMAHATGENPRWLQEQVR